MRLRPLLPLLATALLLPLGGIMAQANSQTAVVLTQSTSDSPEVIAQLPEQNPLESKEDKPQGRHGKNKDQFFKSSI